MIHMQHRVKCLLVDDLEENLLALSALLRRDDVEVLTARSGSDALELLLEHEQSKEKLTLVKEKVAISPESVATFDYTWPAGGDRVAFEVRKDQEFSLKPQEEIKYKVIDVQPTKAVIVNNQKPNEPIEIGLLAP